MKAITSLILLLLVVGVAILAVQEPMALLTVPLGLVKFAVAAIVLNVLLRLMDHINGINFKQFLNGKNEVAHAIYFSVRLLTLGLLAIACLA